MKTIGIIGLGLMGGSLGLALKRSGAAHVKGYARREEARREAVRRGAVDETVESAGQCAEGADGVVFCLPVLAIPEAVRECRAGFKRGAVATDVGSTKRDVVGRCAAILDGSGAVFVGSHPMAGSDASGIAAARADLYDGAVVAVTPCAGQPEEASRFVDSLWTSVGGRPVRMEAGRHDQLVARTSHLPHLVAAALVHLMNEGGAKAEALCGPGFRDSTRVAAGSADLWHDIIKTNRDCVLGELDAMAGSLASLRGLLERGDFEQIRLWLSEAQTRRRSMESARARKVGQ